MSLWYSRLFKILPPARPNASAGRHQRVASPVLGLVRRVEKSKESFVRKTFWIVILVLFAAGRRGGAVDVHDTRMLSQPAISKTHIAFIYAGDLWVADHEGKNVRRLTTDPSGESNPAFSPDGSLIAFDAQYEGNTDVYVVPVSGGVPKR